MRSWVWIIALVGSATAHAQEAPVTSPPVAPPPVAPPATCVPECRDGYLCIGGKCVSACNPACADGETCVGRGVCERRDKPREPDRIVVTPVVTIPPVATITEPPSPSANSNVAFHLNLLGLLELGPTIALELGGKHASLSLRFRAINAGALSYVIIADASSGDVLEFSYGLAAQLRIYTAVHGNMRGFFWGPAVEFVHARVVEDESIAYTTELVIPEFELGYRWAFGNFLVEIGGGFGYGIVTSAESELLSEGGTYYPNDAQNGANALGTVSVGAFF